MGQFDHSKDYYSILGAHRNASRREIEKLYRRLARTRHPDRGGAEDDMKILNEAYRVLHSDTMRSEYDAQLRQPAVTNAPINVAAAAREVGTSGQLLSSSLCLLLGLMLLLLVRFNGLWFLWPLAILAFGVMLFGVMIAHSAMSNAREKFARAHPFLRFRLVRELAFWLLFIAGCVAIYLLLTTV